MLGSDFQFVKVAAADQGTIPLWGGRGGESRGRVEGRGMFYQVQHVGVSD